MYKVGVIGLGNIAAGYGGPEDPAPYCHVGGIRLSKKVELTAVADIAESSKNTFRDKWGRAFPDTLKYYESDEAMLDAERLDIVAVCVRGPHHFSLMKKVLGADPKAVFLEKPPTCSLEEMDTIMAEAKKKNISITVSYSRHWAPQVLRLQELIQQGLIGEVKTVVGYTGLVVLSLASHTTDLICQFAGYCPKIVYAHGTISGDAPDGFEPEPSLDNLVIEFENGIMGVQVNDHVEHGGFYCDVFGTEGRIRAGIYLQPFACKGRKSIDLTKYNIPEKGSASPFTVAYDQIADYLNGGHLPHCTNDDFIAVHEIGFGTIESIHTGKRITLPNQNRSRRIFANG